MLRPSKHSHPDQTVIAASTVLLKELRRKRTATYEELRAALLRRNQNADFLFAPAISLLYLLGLTEYQPIVDSFEYRGN